MMRAGFVVMAMGLASAAHAGPSCTFTVECYEAEACAETSFSLTVTDTAIETDFGTAEIVWRSEDGLSLLTQEPGAVNLLSIADGVANYSVHLPDVPEVITYHGTCEGS